MLTVIGDLHGKFNKYKQIVDKCEYSFQLGDSGFSSFWNKLHYSDIDPDCHKIMCGNHCDYDIAPKSPFYAGNYGLATVGGVEFFYVRGGLSIDRLYREVERIKGGARTYWTQEELNFAEMLDCIELYRQVKPDIVISHVPPSRFITELTSSDRILTEFGFHDGFRENTSLLCNELLNIHTPNLWISGHFHRSLVSHSVAGMKFVSLAELETYEILDTL
jgi:hypothetical protein